MGKTAVSGRSGNEESNWKGKGKEEVGRGQHEWWNKDFLEMLLRHEEMTKDLGTYVYKVAQGKTDRTAIEQEYIPIQESTERCRKARQAGGRDAERKPAGNQCGPGDGLNRWNLGVRDGRAAVLGRK